MHLFSDFLTQLGTGMVPSDFLTGQVINYAIYVVYANRTFNLAGSAP